MTVLIWVIGFIFAWLIIGFIHASILVKMGKLRPKIVYDGCFGETTVSTEERFLYHILGGPIAVLGRLIWLTMIGIGAGLYKWVAFISRENDHNGRSNH